MNQQIRDELTTSLSSASLSPCLSPYLNIRPPLPKTASRTGLFMLPGSRVETSKTNRAIILRRLYPIRTPLLPSRLIRCKLEYRCGCHKHILISGRCVLEPHLDELRGGEPRRWRRGAERSSPAPTHSCRLFSLLVDGGVWHRELCVNLRPNPKKIKFVFRQKCAPGVFCETNKWGGGGLQVLIYATLHFLDHYLRALA